MAPPEAIDLDSTVSHTGVQDIYRVSICLKSPLDAVFGTQL